MGKVQNTFGNGSPGAVSRSIDDIIISIKNASDSDIPFGTPVFMGSGGAVPFDVESPQEASAFLGFAIRVADKTPDEYPAAGPFDDQPEGTWHKGDVMEVLTRGCVAVPMTVSGSAGDPLYIRKNDGKITANAGASGSTIQLTNARLRNPRSNYSPCAEVILNKRNVF